MSSRILDHGGGTYSASSSRPSLYLLMTSSSVSASSWLGSSLGTKLQTSCTVNLCAAENWTGGASKAPTGISVAASHTKNAPPGSLTPSMSRLAVYTARPRSSTSSATDARHRSSTRTASTILPLGWGMPMLPNFSRRPSRSSFSVAFTSGFWSGCWACAKPRLPRALAITDMRKSSHIGNAAGAALAASLLASDAVEPRAMATCLRNNQLSRPRAQGS
mmetsp:Transcript_6415/g.19395  ORF Transcript_6415/g.19395 Transcript_6415/m.19395 type:complete len:219 (-) Transcript_6415:193-849(-)